MDELYEALEFEDDGFLEELEDDFLYEDEEAFGDEFAEFEDDELFEEIIKPPLPPKTKKKKEAVQAAKVVAKATSGSTKVANAVAKKAVVDAKEFEWEFEFEDDGEWEFEFEAVGGDPELLGEMEELAELIAEAETEEEADAFFGALASLATKALPLVTKYALPAISSWLEEAEDEYEYEFEEEGDPFFGAIASLAAPLIGKGIKALGRLFRGRRRRRSRRRAARRVPRIVAGTVTSLARQARAGIPITPGQVGMTMGSQTYQAMMQPPMGGQPHRAVMQPPMPPSMEMEADSYSGYYRRRYPSYSRRYPYYYYRRYPWYRRRYPQYYRRKPYSYRWY